MKKSILSRGFTLVELMVAMAAGAFLLAGVSLSYSAIKSGIQVSKELENAQEVLRYSNSVLTRSTKQSLDLPVVSADGLTITYTMPSGVITCNGDVSSVAVVERYYLQNNNLMCAKDADTPERLLTGVETLSFSIDNNVVTVNIKPEGLPRQFSDVLEMNIAVSSVILSGVVSS
ncbi:PilW family protein [Pseudoalteromonas sp.]|uniref:PilW family protein n=1 Tax=Pseudoalteromonas sp. TaxID=53249 RepID=UPI003567A843